MLRQPRRGGGGRVATGRDAACEPRSRLRHAGPRPDARLVRVRVRVRVRDRVRVRVRVRVSSRSTETNAKPRGASASR